MFVDAVIDLQQWVECLQQNNTFLFPQCATYYNCGLTIIDSAPRGIIKRVSVIDKAKALPSQNITATKVDNTVESSAPFFDASMVGNVIKFNSGPAFKITTFIDDRHVLVVDETIDNQTPLVIDGGVP